MRKYSNLLAAFGCLIASVTASAQSVTVPRTPSPAATVVQTIGISTVTVKYSRPSVKGRPVWGFLVPYGWNKQPGGTNNDAPWRAGANENTTIQVSQDCMIEGHAVAAGTYGMFFVINKDNSGELVLSKDNQAWGNYFYDPSHDLMRTKITVNDAPYVERLTYDFDSLTKTSAQLLLHFEKKEFPVKISFAVDDIVLANAAQELNGAIGFGWQAYVSAANYALQNHIPSDQVVAWSDKAIAMNKNFTTLRVRADLLDQQGKTDSAKKYLDESMTFATEAELNAYGYQEMGANQVGNARSAFIAATVKYPKSANAWDSLGEYYALQGDKKNAILNFRKSLSLNPPAATKANSEKYLAQLSK